ncbi:MAG: methyltransferase domain-containing protein [Candidatus Aminicenantia bacterium]
MIRNFLKKLYFVPSPTLNIFAKRNMKKIMDLLREKENIKILNIGCGERFISGKVLTNKYKKINVDIFPFHGVDTLADAHFLPFKEETFDLVICQALLEHTKAPWKVSEEILRVLKKGGIVYAEVPFLQGFHPSPDDFYSFTIHGIEEIFSKFKKIEANVCVGPSSTLSWILREYISGFFTLFSNHSYFQKIVYFFSGWLTFPIKYIDYIFPGKSLFYRIASGIYFIGEK